VADLRTITEVAPLVRSGAVSPVDLVTACLAEADSRSSLNAFITLMRDSALEEARKAQEEIHGGRYRGPLHGIPIAVKDLIDVAGTRTTSGSAIPIEPSSSDAVVVGQLRRAGAIIIGKTNLHEFAFGTTSEETAFGPVVNPLDLTRSAGGSSGGSAAALAAGMAFGALGTDTGGSIRIPSAACGTVGLKAGFGEISCEGVVPLCVTLDHVGPMARSVRDTALMYAALTPSTVATEPEEPSRRLRFGILRGYFDEFLDEGTARAIERVASALRGAGHTVSDVTIPDAAWTPHVYLHVCLPEASWYHAPWMEKHASRYSPGVYIRLELGRYVLAEDYVRAMRLREGLTMRVEAALEGCDALLLGTMPTGATLLGATTVGVGGRKEPIRAAMLRLTQLFNLTGHPALALPAGTGSDGLPRSVQLVGRKGRTPALLQAGGAVAALA
jgi:aspartyl-tRNA(Asn)/glutamyl-tRNA(Gln) amidotransferase subunit A